MRQVIITESSLRGLLRELMNSFAPIHANPVVDPQAAETDPTNQNFVPTNKTELMSALRALVEPIADEDVTNVYVAIKDAVEEKEEEMKTPVNQADLVETVVRQAIRKILKESFLNEETAAEKRERLSKTAHSKPVFMLVMKSIVDDLGIEYDTQNVNGEMVKVDLLSLNPEEKSKLIAASREAGKLSKVLEPGVSGYKRKEEESAEEKYKKDVAELREKFNTMKILTSEEEAEVKDMLNDDDAAIEIAKSLYEIPSVISNAFCSTFNQVSDVLKDPENIEMEDLSPQELAIIQSPQAVLSTKMFEEIFKEKTKQDFRKYVEALGKKVLNKMSSKKQGYFSGASSDLKKIGKEVGLSVSGVKKESNIALGKYMLGMSCIKLEQYLNI